MDDNAADPHALDPLFRQAMAEFARLFEAAGAAGEPDRTAMTGLLRETRRAIRENFRGFPIDSR